jgi:hypothetical protein
MFVLCGLLIAGGVYMYLHRRQLGLIRSSGSSDQAPPAAIAWTLVDRSSEGFAVEMPAGAKEAEVPAYNEGGTTEPVAMIYSYPDPSTSYSISWEDNPPVVRATGSNPDQTLEDARNGALARTRTVLVSEAQSMRQGNPTRDFVGRNQNGGIFDARLVLADHRLYLLMASFPAPSARRQSDVNRFFDSFRMAGSLSPQ